VVDAREVSRAAVLDAFPDPPAHDRIDEIGREAHTETPLVEAGTAVGVGLTAGFGAGVGGRLRGTGLSSGSTWYTRFGFPIMVITHPRKVGLLASSMLPRRFVGVVVRFG
jgi:hypothetical protein